MELDFSALNRIGRKDQKAAAQQEAMGEPTEQKLIKVEEADQDNPFTQASAPLSDPEDDSISAIIKRTEMLMAKYILRSISDSEYKRIYRDIYNFHTRHSPPKVDRSYWQTHTAGTDAPPPAEVDYWSTAAADLREVTKAYQDDPFMTDLLSAVYAELERQYIAMRDYKPRLEGREGIPF